MKRSLGAATFACPCPVWCIGTYDSEGKPNMMAAAWAGICCSRPPSVSVSLRKATYSYAGIIDSGAFTVNIPSESQAREVDFWGIVSGKNRHKFIESGLTPVKAGTVHAPCVVEFPLVLECALRQRHEIGLHTQFIGEILDVRAEEEVLNEHGMPDMSRIRPFLYSPAERAYYSTGPALGHAYELGRDLAENNE